MVSKSIDTGDEADGATAESFVIYYNDNIPPHHPAATLKKLRDFQEQHPSLFSDDRAWYVYKHRKRFMDWLVSHR